jgi:hypothetical protein
VVWSENQEVGTHLTMGAIPGGGPCRRAFRARSDSFRGRAFILAEGIEASCRTSSSWGSACCRSS